MESTQEDPKQKPKADRVQEGITILKKLREVGIPPTDPGFTEIQNAISAWVRTGEAANHRIVFSRVDRIAELVLPRKRGAVANCTLKAT
jgi:hypothetical protein